jgi:CheY-like chemotaxis protein
LEKAGVAVDIADDGVHALAALQRKNYDAVLMDMQMPEMDGLEATRQIRKNPAWDNLPVIAMTANAMRGDKERCLAAGMNDYLSKPLHHDLLYATLARWTNRGDHELGHVQEVQATQEVLDAENAMARMGSERLYHSMLAEFSSGQRHAVQAIQDALDANDAKLAERLAHSLKGVAASVGATVLSDSAKRLEQQIREGKTGSCLAPMQRLAEDMVHALESIESYLVAHAASDEQ